MSTIKIINELYSNYGYSSIKSSKFNMNEYSVNIFIIIFILLVCLFLYSKNHLDVDKKNWDIQKCYPKYIFFSGYLHNDIPNQSAYETSVYNFYDCIDKYERGYSKDNIGGILYDANKSFNKKIMKIDNDAKEERKRIEKEMKQKGIDISGQLSLLEEKALSLDASETIAYTQLKSIGIYMDQLNEFLNFIGAYTKQYLTYRMMHFANKCIATGDCRKDGEASGSDDYNNAMKIKNILDDQFGGNNL